jgi:hypothetical protein
MDASQTAFTADAIIDAVIFEMDQLGIHGADGFSHLQGLLQQVLAIAVFNRGADDTEDFDVYLIKHGCSSSLKGFQF